MPATPTPGLQQHPMWRWSSWRNSRCELPAYSTLDRLAAKVRTEVNGGFHRLVAARLDAGARTRLLELLIVDPGSRRSRLAELTQPAPKSTVTRFKPGHPEATMSRKVGLVNALTGSFSGD